MKEIKYYCNECGKEMVDRAEFFSKASIIDDEGKAIPKYEIRIEKVFCGYGEGLLCENCIRKIINGKL